MSDVQHRLIFTPEQDDNEDWRCTCGQWVNQYGDDPDVEFAKHRAGNERTEGADDYTPTTGDVRAYYHRAVDELFGVDGEDAFDRWLAAHDAQVKAEALREAVDTFGPMWKSGQVSVGEICRTLRLWADEIMHGGGGEG